MLKEDRTENQRGQILALYTIVYLAIAFLPVLKYSVPYLAQGLICLSYVLLVFLKETRFRIIIILLFVLGLIGGALSFVNGEVVTEVINEPIRVLRCVLPCFILGDLCRCSQKTKLFIWLFLSGLLLFIAINTSLELTKNDMIARLLASGDTDESLTQYRMRNIGGFGFSYAIGITFPLWLRVFFKTNNRFLKIVSLIAAAFIAGYIVLAQYMILFVLCMMSLLLTLVFNSKKVIVTIFCIVAVFVSLLFASSFFRWMAGLDIGSLMQRRLNSIADFFEGKKTLEELTVRFRLYKDAINDFAKHPILGTPHSVAAADSHSWILGVAASTGLVGISCLTGELVVYFKLGRYISLSNGLDSGLFMISFLMFLFLSVLNPIQYAYEIFIVLFLYIPLTLCLFGKNERIAQEGQGNE